MLDLSNVHIIIFILNLSNLDLIFILDLNIYIGLKYFGLTDKNLPEILCCDKCLEASMQIVEVQIDSYMWT